MPMCQLLALDLQAAIAAYAAALEDAIRAYGSTLPEPCVRAKVTFFRPDGTAIEIREVLPADANPVCPASDSPSL